MREMTQVERDIRLWKKLATRPVDSLGPLA
jgi:hypothetical protein